MATSSAPFCSMQQLDQDARPLQIVRLDFKENKVVVDDENVSIMSQNLKATNADSVSIVAIMGTWRTGKSFMLDLLMRYLRRWEYHLSNEMKKTEVSSEAFRRASAAASFESKTEEQARAAGHAAAKEAIRSLPEVQFPLAANSQWRMKGPSCPLPAWVHCTAAAVQANSGPERESAGLADGAGFEWKVGMDRCTEGIWLWSRPFILPYKDSTVAVLLMDTQGAWDAQMSKEQIGVIFGLTALLASQFIVNLQNMLSDDKIDAIDYFTTFAKDAVRGMITEGEAPFGHLEFLIRDWPWYTQGMGFQECKDMSRLHLDNMMKGRKDASQRLHEIFRSVSCFGLPHPGLGVLDPSFQGEFSEINNDFFQMLDEFTRTFFHPDNFPQPSTPAGTQITPSSFENILKNFVEAFAEAKGHTVELREAFVSNRVFTSRDILIDQFKKSLAEAVPESRPIDPELFDQATGELWQNTLKEFQNSIRTFKLQDEEKRVEEFKEAIKELLTRRRTANSSEIDSAQMKLIATPAVGMGVYFMTGHPLIDSGIVAAAGYMVTNKRMKELGKTNIDGEVVGAVAREVTTFAQNRVRDVQAMFIAAQRCTPQTAMDQVMDRARMLGPIAATAAAGAGAATNASSSSGVPNGAVYSNAAGHPNASVLHNNMYP